MTSAAVRGLLTRSQPQAQALIGDLVATYWSERADLIPSAALVELLADFGLSAASSRTALSRLARRGWIVRRQEGRRTFYRHTRAGAERLAEARAQVMSFGPRPDPWDGRWVVIAFNVPERERALRHLLRQRLRDSGFRPLYDAVWVNPRGSAPAAESMLEAIGVERATVFAAETRAAIDAAELFDLAGTRRALQAFLDDFGRFAGARLEPGDALVVRTIAWDRWRAVVRSYADVPAELLPSGWPRGAAQELFARLHARLERPAAERVNEAVAGPARTS